MQVRQDPSVLFYKRMKLGNGKEAWGAEPGKMYFVIKLKRRSE